MNSTTSKLNKLLRKWSYQPPFPVVLQSDETECGLASLAMVFSAMGRTTCIEDLRKDYGSTRGGETIGDLCKFAERYGFRTFPSRSRLDQIDQESLPCILFARGEHFSVLWKIDNNRFSIADPSDGCLLLDSDQFNSYYSGIFLKFRKIYLQDKNNQLIPESVTKPEQTLLPIKREVTIPVLIIAFIIAILTLATASFQDIFMTYVVEEGDILWTRGLVNLTVGFSLILAAATFVLQLILQRFLQINILQWNIRLFNSLFNAPYSFFINKTTGLISSRFNQVDEALSGFQSAALSALLGSLNLFIFLIVIIWVSIPLSIVSAIGITGFIFTGIKFFGYNLQTNYLLRQAECEASSAEFKLISGREQIVIEKNQASIMRELATGYVNQSIAELKISRVGSWNEFFLSTIDLLLNALLLIVSAILIINGNLSTGTYAAVSVIIGTALQPVRSLAQIIEVLQNSRLSFDTANELLQTAKTPESTNLEPKTDQPALEIKGVSFRYSIYGENIHNNVNLKLASKNDLPIIVRLDGGTGAGKTTLFNLILGLLKPSKGELLINGIDIHSLSQSDRNQMVQLVDRNPFILPDTVINNALLGSKSKIQDLHQCLRTLGLDQESLFREQANRLLNDVSSISTGQGVMIGLVRALLIKPRLLLLDEALTSLPEDSHIQILRGIRQLGINIIVIQHGASKVLANLPTVQITSIQSS